MPQAGAFGSKASVRKGMSISTTHPILLHPRVPDAIPFPRVRATGAHQGVGHQAGRIHLEEVARLLVQERVHRPHEAVVGTQELVALAGVALELVGLGVEQRGADVEVVAVEDHADLGALGRCAAEHRILHDELAAMLRAAPGRFIEHAVEHDPLVIAHTHCRHRPAARVHDFHLRRSLRRRRRRRQQQRRCNDPSHPCLCLHRAIA
jgi:hypothetical protein